MVEKSMTKNEEEKNEHLPDEEIDESYVPTAEDFLVDEEEDESTIKKKQRRTKLKRWIAIGVAFVLFLNGFAFIFQQYSMDTIEFLKTSYRLSQQEDIQTYKQAVVTIQGERLKGTGFNIAEDGLIVTNHHVIEGLQGIGVSFPNGEMYVATIIESYPEIDIAFLQIEGEHLPYLSLRENSGDVDEHIYVIGNPLSFAWISNEGEILSYEEEVVTISAPIYRGNSGSPVIGTDGEVVAVVYAKTVPAIGSGDSSVGLAVPVEKVRKKLANINE